jgi:ABC-type lipoprotein export system ATPase subunit
VMALLDEVSAARQLTLVLVTHDPALRDRFERVLDVGPLGAPV